MVLEIFGRQKMRLIEFKIWKNIFVKSIYIIHILLYDLTSFSVQKIWKYILIQKLNIFKQ